jgi:hypothetical protein
VQRPICVEVCACAGRVRVPPHPTTPLDRATTPVNTLHPRYNTSRCFFLFFFFFFWVGGRDPHPERNGHHETATDSRANWAGPHGGLPPLCLRVSGLGFRVLGLGSVITARCRVVRDLSLSLSRSLSLSLSLSLSPCPYVVLKKKTRTRTRTRTHRNSRRRSAGSEDRLRGGAAGGLLGATGFVSCLLLLGRQSHTSVV